MLNGINRTSESSWSLRKYAIGFFDRDRDQNYFWLGPAPKFLLNRTGTKMFFWTGTVTKIFLTGTGTKNLFLKRPGPRPKTFSRRDWDRDWDRDQKWLVPLMSKSEQDKKVSLRKLMNLDFGPDFLQEVGWKSRKKSQNTLLRNTVSTSYWFQVFTYRKRPVRLRHKRPVRNNKYRCSQTRKNCKSVHPK
jgi:hypothetical protein